MKKKLMCVLLTLCLTGGAVTGCGSSGNISKAEFEKIDEGMTYEEVVDIIGSKGELISSSGGAKMYSWKGNGTLGANANVTFLDGKVEGKAQTGLR